MERLHKPQIASFLLSAKADFALRAQPTVNNLRTKDSGLRTDLFYSRVFAFIRGEIKNISPAETRSAAEGGHMNAKLPMS